MDPNLTPPHYYQPQDESIDLKRYISLFISNWYWFAISLFIALSVAYGINRYSVKIYTVSATLLIKDDQTGSLSSSVENVIPGGDIFKSQQNLLNEMGILRSFRLNDSVMKKLEDFHVVYVSVGRRGIVESRMYKTCPFRVIYDSLELQPKRRVDIEILSDTSYKINLNGDLNLEFNKNFGERFKEQGFDFIVIPRFPGRKIIVNNSSNKYYFYFIDPENLANQYRGKLSVAPIEEEASIVTLSVSGFDPVQEADYLNKLMDVYINYGLENKTRTAEKTIEFIDEQVKIISDSLFVAEGKMERFRLENSFFDLSSKGALIQNRLERIENEKTAFELQLQYYKYLSEYLNLKNTDGTIISPSLMGITDGILIRLVNDLSAMQKDREKLGFNLEDNQLAIEYIDRQVDETREALMENIRNGINSLKLSIAESDRKLSVVDTEINNLPRTEREFIKIQRKFDLNNTVYTYLLEKRAESGIARASNIPDNRVIDNASQFSSGLIKPKTRQNFMIALILGLLFPMAGISLIDYFNDKVIDKRDVEKKTKVPVIGYISHSESRTEMPVVEKPGSSLAESFRAVRTSIKYYVKENERAIIAISSTISSEGKTFISINLAAIIAMLGKRVLLVGLDLRKPRINRVFEFEDSPGMSTFLSGNCVYEDVIKQTQISNLFYAPSGPIPPNPAELIETGNMRKFIETAKTEFDYIIFDTPPIAIVTDALLLAPFVDLNLFIVRQRYTSRNTLDMIEQLYKQGELKNMAIIINDINLSGYYGYGMRYGYSLGYGYSYGYNYYGKGYYGKYGYADKSKGYYTEE
jgi:capsular exopolysaccharide synthesis family protein